MGCNYVRGTYKKITKNSSPAKIPTKLIICKKKILPFAKKLLAKYDFVFSFAEINTSKEG